MRGEIKKSIHKENKKQQQQQQLRTGKKWSQNLIITYGFPFADYWLSGHPSYHIIDNTHITYT